MKQNVAFLIGCLASVQACGSEPVRDAPPGDGSRVESTPDSPGSIPGARRLGSVVCFYSEEDRVHPAATIEHRLELIEEVETLHARLTLDPRFVDNTYGETAVGWNTQEAKKPKKRTFDQLVGSDHAVLRMLDASGDTALQLKIDYISETSDAPSGYATLGVWGGEGEMLLGDESAVRKVSTSLDRNLNERGYDEYLESSPPTDAAYTPSAQASDWEYPVVYEAWVDLAAFPGGFGDAHVEFIHASPSKTGNNTVTVERDRCPPEFEPPVSAEPPPENTTPPPECHLDSDCDEGEICFAGECKERPTVI